MAESKLKKNIIIIAAVVVGLIVGVIYGQVRLGSQEKMYLTKLKEVNQRLTQSQRKVTEGKNLQTTLEEEKQQSLAEAEKLSKEKERLAADGKALKSKSDALEAKTDLLEKKTGSLESANKRQIERLEKVEAERDALDKKQRQTLKTLSEREGELKDLHGKYNRCAENNARLYGIGEELIDKYKKKGVMGTLLEKEPFTQIKKVELEALVQEYRDKIDQQKLKTSQQK